MSDMKSLCLCLLFGLSATLVQWGEQVADWVGSFMGQVQAGTSPAPTFRSEEQALAYLESELERFSPKVSLRLRRGMDSAFARKAADMAASRGYANHATYYVSEDELTFIPTYSDWVLMRAVFLGQQPQSVLSAEMKRAYRRALSSVEAEREKLKEVNDGEERERRLALALHDYLCHHASYSPKNRESVTTAASLLLLKGRGVCEGYARAYALLLTMAGIENRYICGHAKGVDHAWNMVKLGGRWCHVDVTYDDRGGAPSRLYCDLSDRQVARDHRWERAHWPKAPEAR